MCVATLKEENDLLAELENADSADKTCHGTESWYGRANDDYYM